MKNKITLAISFLLWSCNLFSQNGQTINSDSLLPAQTVLKGPFTDIPQKDIKPKQILKPTIGLGVGILSFYGDVKNKQTQSLLTGRIAYDLVVAHRISKSFVVNFNLLYGKVGANERLASGNGNINFESEIRASGLSVVYDFSNLLPATRSVTPFVSLGFESFEFLSKTDLYDKNGNKYNYWTDGTIRNLPQNAPNASSATLLQRDYTYESDVRETNVQKYGKYAERSFAIPVGAGFSFKINDYVSFRVSSILHLTFTDHIDGVVDNTKFYKFIGKSRNDNFAMTSFGINYNFGYKPLEQMDTMMQYIDTKGVDFFAMDTGDKDQDGVPDIKDQCQGTPIGVDVDSVGCPYDEDGDGYPDYKDLQINSPKNAIVDTRGVQLTDSAIAFMYGRFTDTATMTFANVQELQANGDFSSGEEYVVGLGTFENGVSSDLLTKFLSIRDIAGINLSENTSMYIAGSFNTREEAEKRAKEIIADGIPDAKIMYKENDIYHYISSSTKKSALKNQEKEIIPDLKPLPATDTELANNTEKENTITSKKGLIDNGLKIETLSPISSSDSAIVYRVQLGAYSKRLSKTIFLGVHDLVEIKTEDGLYKYATGSFPTMESASTTRVNMLIQGYEGAFITAYKNGKRIGLEAAGAIPAEPKTTIEEVSDTAKISVVDKKAIVFKLQVGIYKDKPPVEKIKLFEQMQEVVSETTTTGLTRYLLGNFNDYIQAEGFRYEIIKKYGITDPFVIAEFNGEYITVQEALELLR